MYSLHLSVPGCLQVHEADARRDELQAELNSLIRWKSETLKRDVVYSLHTLVILWI
jgi:hypothetical protein